VAVPARLPELGEAGDREHLGRVWIRRCEFLPERDEGFSGAAGVRVVSEVTPGTAPAPVDPAPSLLGCHVVPFGPADDVAIDNIVLFAPARAPVCDVRSARVAPVVEEVTDRQR
jgi:hypothetical protein